jgi:hypothetical protein
MPEVFPSPAQGPNIDRCWTCRSMVMQAWGNYGTAWPVVHQWLGVSPDLGRHVVDVVPQVPAGQTLVRGSDIRLGAGSADVTARHDGSRYTTWVSLAPGTGARQLVIGHTLPRGQRPTSVLLDGHVVDGWHVVQTDRGTEVTVATTAGTHTLVVTT